MSKVKLYKYQEEAFNNTMEIYKSSDRACVIMATGTGKSYVMMRLLEEFDKVDGKAYILTPNNPTKEQTIEKMVEYGLNNAEFGLYQTINAMTDEELEAFKGNDEYLKTLSNDQIKKLMKEENEYISILNKQYAPDGNETWMVRYVQNTSTGTWSPFFFY